MPSHYAPPQERTSPTIELLDVVRSARALLDAMDWAAKEGVTVGWSPHRFNLRNALEKLDALP